MFTTIIDELDKLDSLLLHAKSLKRNDPETLDLLCEFLRKTTKFSDVVREELAKLVQLDLVRREGYTRLQEDLIARRSAGLIQIKELGS